MEKREVFVNNELVESTIETNSHFIQMNRIGDSGVVKYTISELNGSESETKYAPSFKAAKKEIASTFERVKETKSSFISRFLKKKEEKEEEDLKEMLGEVFSMASELSKS